MAKLEIDIPQQIYERLQAESKFSGEPMESIISRSLMLYFANQTGEGYGDTPFTIFKDRDE